MESVRVILEANANKLYCTREKLLEQLNRCTQLIQIDRNNGVFPDVNHGFLRTHIPGNVTLCLEVSLDKLQGITAMYEQLKQITDAGMYMTYQNHHQFNRTEIVYGIKNVERCLSTLKTATPY